MIVVIPLLVRLGIVAIELQSIIVAIEIENVRIAIAVCFFVCDAIRATAHLIALRKEIGLYFIWEQDSTSIAYQVNFFFGLNMKHPTRSLDLSYSRSIYINSISESLDRPIS